MRATNTNKAKEKYGVTMCRNSANINSASEMTCIVSGGALNSTHPLRT